MQTRYIYLILLTFLFSCQNDKEKSENKKWISTYSTHWSKPGIYMEITDTDSLMLTRDFDFKHLQKHKYYIDSSNNLILDDTLLYGQIMKQTDYQIIIKDTFYTKTFIPIIDYSLDTDTSTIKNLLVSNDWSIKENSNSLRIEFKNIPFYLNPSRLNIYYRINETKGWESFDCEWWALEKFENSIFLILSFWQIDYQVYQIKNITDSSLVTETCWTDSTENVIFSVQKKLSKNDYQKYSDNLIGTWKLIDFEEPIDSAKINEGIIPIKRKGRVRPYADKDSVPMILFKYFKNKSITYSFNDNGECSMDTKGLNLRTANWKLSDDGKYIQTDDGWMRTMRIISISDSILVTEKHETIEYEDKYDWTDNYIREKLIKIK